MFIVLLSKNERASEACQREVAFARTRHMAGSLLVLPVLLEPDQYEDHPLGHIQGAPTTRQPISAYADQGEGWRQVAEALESALFKPPSAFKP